MPELLAALDAFVQEHRRCGELGDLATDTAMTSKGDTLNGRA
jgi:hypothetical protein